MDSWSITKSRDKENYSGLTSPSTKATGKMTRPTERVESFIPTGSSTRAIGCREKCTAEVHTSIQTVQFTSGIGKKINRMAKVYKLVIINTHTRANTAKVKNTGSER